MEGRNLLRHPWCRWWFPGLRHWYPRRCCTSACLQASAGRRRLGSRTSTCSQGLALGSASSERRGSHRDPRVGAIARRFLAATLGDRRNASAKTRLHQEGHRDSQVRAYAWMSRVHGYLGRAKAPAAFGRMSQAHRGGYAERPRGWRRSASSRGGPTSSSSGTASAHGGRRIFRFWVATAAARRRRTSSSTSSCCQSSRWSSRS